LQHIKRYSNTLSAAGSHKLIDNEQKGTPQEAGSGALVLHIAALAL